MALPLIVAGASGIAAGGALLRLGELAILIGPSLGAAAGPLDDDHDGEHEVIVLPRAGAEALVAAVRHLGAKVLQLCSKCGVRRAGPAGD